MQSQFLSPVKDGRRVLGEKPANACLLSPARNNRTVDATGTLKSPVKRSLFINSRNVSPSATKKLLPSPSFAGQKRTIDQVEEPINSGGLQVQETRSAGEDGVRSPSRVDSVPVTSIPRQQQTWSIDTQQKPSSMNVSKRGHGHGHGHDPTRTVPEDPETRKVFIQQKANLLRTRIQSAMCHVRDDQLDRRISDLEAHSRKHPRLSNRPSQPQPQNTQLRYQPTAPEPTPAQTESFTPITTSPISEPTPQPRTLQPAPNLKPHTQTRDGTTAGGLSSPPLSMDHTTTTQHDPMRTPTQQSFHNNRRHGSETAGSPAHLSSPPATVSRVVGDGDRDVEGQCQGQEGVGRRASQKGDAVDGLLKLMNTDADAVEVDN